MTLSDNHEGPKDVLNGQSLRVGIDIGGTFTDAVAEAGSQRRSTKVLTTPQAPETAALESLDRVVQDIGAAPGDVDLIIHGTTLATNALIERRGAVTGLITTEGFRDVLEIRHEDRYEQYDLTLTLPPPLVPRARRLPVGERVDASGRVVRPLDEAAVVAAARQLGAQGVEAVAIGFLHSYANPAHEQRAAEIVRAALPGAAITLSAEVAPEMREYQRFSTAVANAYIQPLMDRYLAGLADAMAARGYGCPLLLMLSSGGLTALETARRFPVRLVESGPAGGAIFAREIGREAATDDLLAFDMGGTTAKLCLIDGGQAQTSRDFEVARVWRFRKGSGLPLRIPVIEMVEIGAGGGSIAGVDALGRVAVGPRSAGSEPGPAAYGRGGTDATVTDADLVLGRLDPGRFAGGKIALDAAASETAVERSVGRPIAAPVPIAAIAISEMVEETMADAARVHAIESGTELGHRTMVAFGGAAPNHALRLADKLGIRRVLIPPGAGVGSAIGFLRAPAAYEVVRSLKRPLDRLDAGEVAGMLASMATEARDIVRRAAPGVAAAETVHAAMRYVGQGHEIEVILPGREATDLRADHLATLYEARYRQVYGRLVPDGEIEVLTWSVRASAATARPASSTHPAGATAAATTETRRVIDGATGETTDIPCYWRRDLPPGARLDGPAVIAEAETSTLLPAGVVATVLAGGIIDCRRQETVQ